MNQPGAWIALLISLLVPQAAVGQDVWDVGDLMRLSRDEASKRAPIRLQGVVTYADPVHRDFFIQSGTNATSMWHPNPSLPIRRGDVIEVMGYTDPGDFAPKLIPMTNQVRVLGRGDLPPPMPLRRLNILAGTHDCRRVEAEVVIRSIQWHDSQLEFTLGAMSGTAAGSLRILIPEPNSNLVPTDLIGALVRVVGVAATDLSRDGQLIGIRFYCQSLSDLEVLQSARPFAQLPQRHLNQLLRYDPAGQSLGRVLTRGTVTFSRPDGVLFVQDGLTAAMVSQAVRDPASLPVPGAAVDIVGFPTYRGGLLETEHSVVVVNGTGTEIRPGPIESFEQLMGSTNDCHLVSVTGDLLSVASRNEELILSAWMPASQSFLEARLRSDQRFDLPIDFKQGARLRFTGIKMPVTSALLGKVWPVILLRSAADVQVVQTAPFWTRGRLAGLVVAVTLAAVIALIAAGQRRRWIEDRNRELEHKVATRTTELSAANQRLERMNELKTDFLGMAAHDIRSPLTVILSTAELLKLAPGSPVETSSSAEQIRSAALRVAGMVTGFLDAQASDLSMGEIKVAPQDVETMLDDTQRGLDPILRKKNQALSVQLVGGPLTVRADRRLLGSVLQNLAENASKYSPAGSLIRVVGRAAIRPGWVRLEVIDRGPGMGPHDQERLFKRFSRASTQPTAGESSTGLGLGLAKAWIVAMNGEIGCDTAQGTGSTFWIELPAA
jgi:signal transduction histidine kinase